MNYIYIWTINFDVHVRILDQPPTPVDMELVATGDLTVLSTTDPDVYNHDQMKRLDKAARQHDDDGREYTSYRH